MNEIEQRVIELYHQGMNTVQIGEIVGRHNGTVGRILTSLRKKSPTSKREGAPAPVKVGDEFRLALANEYDRIWLERTPSERREA